MMSRACKNGDQTKAIIIRTAPLRRGSGRHNLKHTRLHGLHVVYHVHEVEASAVKPERRRARKKSVFLIDSLISLLETSSVGAAFASVLAWRGCYGLVLRGDSAPSIQEHKPTCRHSPSRFYLAPPGNLRHQGLLSQVEFFIISSSSSSFWLAILFCFVLFYPFIFLCSTLLRSPFRVR